MRIIFVLFFLFVMVGCDDAINTDKEREESMQISELSADDYLSRNNDPDIFKLNHVIFSKMENTLVAQDLELELGELVGEILIRSTDSEQFANGTATKLPVGTKIYELKDHESGDTRIYIAVVRDEKIPYLYRIEG